MKMIISFLLFLSFINICSSADNSTTQTIDYAKMIIGKWQLIATDCDEDGNCMTKVDKNIWISFYQDGKVFMKSKPRKNMKIATYSITDDLVIIKIQRNKTIKIKIKKITENEITWLNMEKETHQKLKKVEDVFAQNINLAKIIGKWKFVGTDCDENGNCETFVKEDAWISFLNNEKGLIKEKSERILDILYSISASTIKIKMSREIIEIIVLKITETEMIWFNIEKRVYQKLQKR